MSYPAYSVVVRRFHDVGVSGWWASPFIFLGLLLSALFAFVPARLQYDLVFSPWSLGVQMAVSLATYPVLFWPGAQGENRFGPPPQATALDRSLGKIAGARFDA